jgi:hypothetical protein
MLFRFATTNDKTRRKNRGGLIGEEQEIGGKSRTKKREKRNEKDSQKTTDEERNLLNVLHLCSEIPLLPG